LAAFSCPRAALTRLTLERSNSVCVTRARPSYALKGGTSDGRLSPGSWKPSVCGLKVRFTHEPVSERFGSNAARACRTRAPAASLRNPAIVTAAGAESALAPVA